MPGPLDMRPLTHERLLEVLDYDPATGSFRWKVRLSRKFPVGAKAGGMKQGKAYVRVDETDYTAARLAWFYVTGKWPHRLKFKDGDKANVRFDNLAETNALPEKYDHSTPEGRAEYLKANREKFGSAWKERHLKATFGLTLADYDAKHSAQGGKCAICGKVETGLRYGKPITLAVDHNHETGAIRDLLCRACNQMIGNAKEDVSILEAAIDYLRRHETMAPMNHPAFYHAHLTMN